MDVIEFFSYLQLWIEKFCGQYNQVKNIVTFETNVGTKKIYLKNSLN